MIKREKRMKRSDSIFPIETNDLFMNSLRKLWEDGCFDEYSDDHVLIRALNNDINAFGNIIKRLKHCSWDYPSDKIDSFTFLINFSNRLDSLIALFGYKQIADFVKSQLSAGKKRYDENTFLEAYTEILVLYYIGTFGPICVSAQYEPTIGEGNHNPEASFEFENGARLDVEVKTARIADSFYKDEVYMPLRCMDKKGIEKFEKQCGEYGVKAVRPRIGKLKDFINSACQKFENIETNKHYNVLVINVSSSNLRVYPYLEIAMLLDNPINGIFRSPLIADNYEISRELYSKVSAIFIISNSVEIMAFTDLRYLFASRNACMILNPYILDTEEKQTDFLSILQMRKNDFSCKMDAEVYFDCERKPSPYFLYLLRKCVEENRIVI